MTTALQGNGVPVPVPGQASLEPAPAFTGLNRCEFRPIDSIAFVVQITRRISTSYSRNGTNSAQEDSQSRTIAGYRWPHSAVNSANRSFALLGRGRVDGLERLDYAVSRCWRPA
ncbi:hypothetical protein QF036_002514 [Arthrobacter globiformis]|nr:hypothetical protein [Arthrobacter globiformis]